MAGFKKHHKLLYAPPILPNHDVKLDNCNVNERYTSMDGSSQETVCKRDTKCYSLNVSRVEMSLM